jgi:hypothetical protein
VAGVVVVNRVWCGLTSRREGKISSFLAITQEVFARNYLRSINGWFSLLEYGNGDCIMYDNGCMLYDVRLCQCRSIIGKEFLLKCLRGNNIVKA